MNIENKTFLVTGAASGIGRELTLELLNAKAKVVATDIDEASLEKLKAEAKNENLITHALDISNKDAVAKVANDFKEIDGLINNAGIIQPFVKVNDLDYKDIEKVMNVNFFGMLYMTKAFLPNLLKRKEAYIANISSMGGFLPVPGQSLYGASKAAVKLLTEGLYAELKETNVGVSVIFPGATKTNIAKNSGINVSNAKVAKNYKTTSANKAAKTIIRGIRKNKFQIFIGSDSKMMNFLYRLNPKYATDMITKQMKSLLK